ncbi:MAG: GNAT family N-acetyltransferase [Pseudomonadota bacterium]
MSNIQIVFLTPERTDYTQQAAELLHQVFGPRGSWATLQDAEEEVAEMLAPERFILIALQDNEVIAWVGGIPEYDGNVWELHPILVKPTLQRSGVGTQLIRAFEAEVKSRGGLTIQLGADDEHYQTSLGGADLYTDLWEKIRDIQNLDNHPFEFYQKMGYTIIGVIPDANGYGKPDIILGKRV